MSTPRRVVTGHDPDGRSVVLADGPAPRSHSIPGATFYELWNTSETPAPLRAREAREPTERPLVTPPDPGGTIVRIVDLPPERGRADLDVDLDAVFDSIGGGDAHLASERHPSYHRTETVDYGIVLAGNVVLVLDDGSETALAAGDAVVQRGTSHAWANTGEGTARMAFVLVDGRFAGELRALLGDMPLFDRALDP